MTSTEEDGWARSQFADPIEGLRTRITALEDQLAQERAAKLTAYCERNYLVAALSKFYPAGLVRTDIPDWDPEWHGCVIIDLPTGQASWHFHDDDADLFAHLGPYAGQWDGHTTVEKYARLAALEAPGRFDHRDD